MSITPGFDADAPDVEAAIKDAVANRDPRSNLSLQALLPDRLRRPEFRSVFIAADWRVGVEEYDGALADAYDKNGVDETEEQILTHLATVLPKLLSLAPDYFTARSFDGCEVVFYTHPISHTTRLIGFDAAGETVRMIV